MTEHSRAERGHGATLDEAAHFIHMTVWLPSKSCREPLTLLCCFAMLNDLQASLPRVS